jgi:TRAP-type mannitol/chloroaromatic compound transport system permease small subunit
MRDKISTIIDSLDAITERSGQLVSWLVLILMILTLIVAVPRYLLSSEWFLELHLFSLDWESIRGFYSQYVNALGDSIQYVHAIIFMVGVSYALKQGDHVRIDIIYRNLKPRARAWVNITGYLTLFLPTFIFLLVMSWPYVMNSWGVMESSARPGGLPLIYLLKTFLLIMPAMMILQGIAQMLRNIQVLLQAADVMSAEETA